MMCLGWSQNDNCGRKQQVTSPSSCPDITWFWAGLGLVLGLTLIGKDTGAPVA